MTLHLIQLIERAKTPEEVFGKASAHLDKVFKEIARQVHPDKNKGSKRCSDAFARLTELRSLAEDRIAAGVYGTSKAVKIPKSRPPVVLTHKSTTTVLGELFALGDMADLFHAEHSVNKAAATLAVAKVGRSHKDSDLLRNEVTILNKLSTAKANKYRPAVLTSFEVHNDKKVKVHVAVLEDIVGSHNAVEIRAHYKRGVPFVHGIWMLNRLLEGIGAAHKAGIVHGAVLPPHALFVPANHRGVLVDWSYAVPIGGKFKALSKKWESFYPTETKKGTASPGTDIYMIARTVSYLLGADDGLPTSLPATIPDYLASFLKGCCFLNPARRPQDAWALRDEFEKVIVSNYGPRKFEVFTMP